MEISFFIKLIFFLEDPLYSILMLIICKGELFQSRTVRPEILRFQGRCDASVGCPVWSAGMQPCGGFHFHIVTDFKKFA